MILAIVGSATLTAEQTLRAAGIIQHVLDIRRPEMVISGGAPGVDTLAKIIARQRGITFREFPPAESNWERGFKPRNIKIAEACTELVRIVKEVSRTYGSGWTRDYAAKLGKPTQEFVIR